MTRKERLFLWLGGLFVAALLVADLIGGKFFRVAGHDLSAGMLAFPLTFVLTDVVNEFYGAHGARRITFLGLGTALFAFAIIQLAMALPPSPESPLSHDVFRSVFGWSTRLYVASLTAYVIGQLLDIAVFGALRKVTRHRFIWLRATGSTVVSQLVDSMVVTFVLLSGTKSTAFILGVVRDSYLVKLVVAIGLTPVIYAAHAVLAKLLHGDETPMRDVSDNAS